MSLVCPSYFDKIPMNIASLLFENSYRIIFILNLNNSASHVTFLESYLCVQVCARVWFSYETDVRQYVWMGLVYKMKMDG